jgi:hypothetical protein
MTWTEGTARPADYTLLRRRSRLRVGYKQSSSPSSPRGAVALLAVCGVSGKKAVAASVARIAHEGDALTSVGPQLIE